MRMSTRSTTLTVFIAAFAAALVLLAAFEGAASARSQARANAGANSSHGQSDAHASVAKNEHGHRHHRHEFKVSRLLERPVYCDCTYESCPEWVLVQCVGYQPRRAPVRQPEPVPRCICSGPDLMDPNYD